MEKFKKIDDKFKCIFCNVIINKQNNIIKHLNSASHQEIEKDSFVCLVCCYATKSQKLYENHCVSMLHNKKNIKYKTNNNKNKIDKKNNQNQNNEVINLLVNKLDNIEAKFNQIEYNTKVTENKIRQIVSEGVDASKLAKTTSSLFNTLSITHHNTPPLLALSDIEIQYLLNEHFNPNKINDEYFIEKILIKCYRKKILINELINLIISKVKNDDINKQGVFVSDISRLTYLVKLTVKQWTLDKKGIKFCERIIKPILTSISTRVNDYRCELDEDSFNQIETYIAYIDTINNLLHDIEENILEKELLKKMSPYLQYISPANLELEKIEQYNIKKIQIENRLFKPKIKVSEDEI